VLAKKDNKEFEIGANVFISDAGPTATVEMAGLNNFDADYLKNVGTLRPAPVVHVAIASDKPLAPTTGVGLTSGVRRVVNSIHMTPTCPQLAPPGQHLMTVWTTPKDCLHHVNFEEEKAAIEDIKDLFPDFEKNGRFLVKEGRDIDHPMPILRT
jgi:phytoene desaturase